MKNTPELPNEIFSEQAKKRVSIGLLLGEFIKQEKIEADDTKTKELLMQELRTKYKITISGPNTLSAILQAYHLGFQTLRVQKHATQIHDDLKNITTRFTKHFDGIIGLRKKLEDAIKATDDFGRDARSIMRTLENIKDPEEIEKLIKEDVDKIKVLNK